jgi:hypothetical protein
MWLQTFKPSKVKAASSSTVMAETTRSPSARVRGIFADGGAGNDTILGGDDDTLFGIPAPTTSRARGQRQHRGRVPATIMCSAELATIFSLATAETTFSRAPAAMTNSSADRGALTPFAAEQAKTPLPMIRSINSATLKCLFDVEVLV